MRISVVRIENFRGIKSIELALDDTTVLIGENNSGKTAVLDALRVCLRHLGPGRRVVFDALDFHLNDEGAEPTSADPIRIEITFSEDAPGEWDDRLIGRLTRDRVLQIGDDQCSHVILQVSCSYDAASRDFVQDWTFLDLNGEPIPAANRALANLQEEAPYFYLTALRDAATHFDANGPFWRPFLRDSQLSVEKKTEIEQKLLEVNDLIISSHSSFQQVQTGLRQVQNVVALASGDVVSVEAVPSRMFDMLAKAQLQLSTVTGAKIPVRRHGEGTQSLAVLMLFSTFLETHTEATPVVALEEPEAHLHPSAIRSLWHLVRDFSGQKLISTHSGDLLAETDIHYIRRLARTNDGISAFQVVPGLLTHEEQRKFNYHIRQARGELLFARCWLLGLVEIQTPLYRVIWFRSPIPVR